eukprot:TRINITY_DN14829_c2_g1_i1.p1 TRINITY_DN14829_c2_g1~~TRINITY_DN14829_c2_g1_i1.p1  ORF type:complete len:685 (+),score=263.93 TRINITY_DN14829_c2_g1_i1:112-2055(+)
MARSLGEGRAELIGAYLRDRERAASPAARRHAGGRPQGDGEPQLWGRSSPVARQQSPLRAARAAALASPRGTRPPSRGAQLEQLSPRALGVLRASPPPLGPLTCEVDAETMAMSLRRALEGEQAATARIAELERELRSEEERQERGQELSRLKAELHRQEEAAAVQRHLTEVVARRRAEETQQHLHDHCLELQERVAELEERRRTAEASAEHWQRAFGECDQRVAEADGRAKSANEALCAAEQRAAQRERELAAELAQAREQTQAAAAAGAAKEAAMRQRYDELRDHCDELARKHADVTAQLTREQQALHARIGELEQQLRSGAEEQGRLTAALSGARARVAGLEEELARATEREQSRVAGLESEVRATEGRCRDSEAQRLHLLQQREQQIAELAEAAAQRDRGDADKAELAAELDKAREIAEAAQRDSRTWRNAVMAADARLEAVESSEAQQRAALSAELATLRERCAYLSRSLAAKDEELKAQEESARLQKERASRELQDERERGELRERELWRCAERITALESRCAAAERIRPVSPRRVPPPEVHTLPAADAPLVYNLSGDLPRQSPPRAPPPAVHLATYGALAPPQVHARSLYDGGAVPSVAGYQPPQPPPQPPARCMGTTPSPTSASSARVRPLVGPAPRAR